MESSISPTLTSGKKHRSEKRPIPEEQKDDKYFERRRRNNQAAKKSRDARKIREDQVIEYFFQDIHEVQKYKDAFKLVKFNPGLSGTDLLLIAN